MRIRFLHKSCRYTRYFCTKIWHISKTDFALNTRTRGRSWINFVYIRIIRWLWKMNTLDELCINDLPWIGVLVIYAFPARDYSKKMQILRALSESHAKNHLLTTWVLTVSSWMFSYNVLLLEVLLKFTFL